MDFLEERYLCLLLVLDNLNDLSHGNTDVPGDVVLEDELAVLLSSVRNFPQ